MSKWVLIAKTRPYSHRAVLVTDGKTVTLGWYIEAQDKIIENKSHIDITDSCTHWQYCPNPPVRELTETTEC